MRKDYTEVDAVTEGLEESAFVERFWTERWRDRNTPADVSTVARREEYRVIRPYLDALATGSRILDGGCGTGEWTVFLAQQGFDVTGIDISRETIARLAKWFPQHRFRHGDLRGTEFPDSSFDAYFSWGTFEHFESGLDECVAEARRIVRRGGWLFVSVPFHNARVRLQDLRRSPDDGRGRRFYQWRLTGTELRDELEHHDFQVHRIVPIGKMTGAGRLLQADLPLFAKGSVPYRIFQRAVATMVPARLIGHMLLAVAERR